MKTKKLFNKSRREKIVFTVVEIIFALYAIVLVYPFVWAFLSSLKSNTEYFYNMFSLPKEWLFSNYITAFELLEYEGTNFVGMIFNSIWFTVGSTVLAVLVSSITAYIVAKYEFFGRNLLYGLAIFIMLIPIVGALPATYKVYAAIGILDSPLIVLSYAGGFGFNFIVMSSFFKALPWSYAEAAAIDGAGHFRILVQVMLPQAVAPIVSLSILAAIGIWNDYMTPILFLPSYQTLASGLYNYQEIMKYKGANVPVYFAGVLMSMVPIMVLFACFSNTIMDKTYAGGLKG